jgi:hypothetical protein
MDRKTTNKETQQQNEEAPKPRRQKSNIEINAAQLVAFSSLFLSFLMLLFFSSLRLI